MVFRICRGILDDHAEAEDAFQATFLHLFRRADSIRNPAAIKYWLCEVARRVAQRARQVRAKRRVQELAAATPGAAPIPDREALEREWRPILPEEIRKVVTPFWAHLTQAQPSSVADGDRTPAGQPALDSSA